jgi:hypothetical protein
MPKSPLLTEGVPIPPLDRVKKTEKESKHPDDVMMHIIFKNYPGEKTMKLNLLFIVMDLLTLLAYPIVFVYGKLGQFSKSKESIPLANLLVTVPVAPGR